MKGAQTRKDGQPMPTQVASTRAQTNIVEPASRQCQWPPPDAAVSTPRLVKAICDAWLQAFGRCWDLNHYQQPLGPRGMLQGDVLTHLIWIQVDVRCPLPTVREGGVCRWKSCFLGGTADGRLKFQLSSLELNGTENVNIFQDTQSVSLGAEVVALPGHTSPALAPQGAVLQNGFAFRNSRPWQVSAAVNDHLPNQNHGPCRYTRSQNDRINGRASPQRDRNSEPLGCQGEIHSNLGIWGDFCGHHYPKCLCICSHGTPN